MFYRYFFLLFTLLFNFCFADIKYDLSICAIFQNEGPYLKEWIEFHKLVGVQHFYLFNNLSTDNYKEVLAPYVKLGEVDLIEFPRGSSNQVEFNIVQMAAYDDGLTLSKDESRWVAFIDVDEFLFAVNQDNLQEFLKKFEGYGGLEVNWQKFGTSAVSKISLNELMIDRLIKKGKSDFYENFNTKSIVQPEFVIKSTGAHNFLYVPGKYSVYANESKTSGNPYSPYLLIDQIRINHYWTRDEYFLWDVKYPRYDKWHSKRKYINNVVAQLNEVEDRTIQRFVPALKKKMNLIPE